MPQAIGGSHSKKANNTKRLYVIEYNGSYKIGASQDPWRRAREISQAGIEASVRSTSQLTKKWRQYEMFLHMMFAGKRLGGEWFFLNETERGMIYCFFGEVSQEYFNLIDRY